MQVQTIRTRPDRLVEIRGERTDETIVELSTDQGSTWRPATVYPGTCVDQWRSCEPAVWNRAVNSGTLPAGNGAFLWNCFFDLDGPAESALLRASAAARHTVLHEESIEFGVMDDVMVVDRRNVVDLCRGRLPAEWSLQAASPDSVESIHRVVEMREVPVEKEQPRAEIAHADLSPLRIGVGVRGWYRIYLGMEPYSACRFWLSRQGVWYEVPNWHVDSPNRNANIKSGEGDRLRQEFYGLPRDEDLFRERALKEAVHELGHTYSLGYCPDPTCVMHFSNSLYDTDLKGWSFCSNCQERFNRNV